VSLAKTLHEERVGLWGKVQEINERAVNEKRGLNAEETEQRSRIMQQIDESEARAKAILDDEQRAKDAANSYNEFAGRAATTGAEVGIERRFRDAMIDIAEKRSNHVDIPRQHSKLMNRLNYGRPMSPYESRTIFDAYVAGGSPGSFTNPSGAGIVPIDFYDHLISYLVEVSGIMQTGPTVINTTGGAPIQMPYVTQHTGQLTGTNQYAQLSAAQASVLVTQDPIFGQKTLTSNKFGQLVQVPRELLDDTGVNLLGYLASSAGRSLGNVIGSALLNGGGGISGPLLANISGVGVTGASGLSGGPTSLSAYGVVDGGPRYQDLVNLQYKVAAPYRQSRSCYWLAADQSVGTLRLLTDTVGRPIWEPSTVLGAPDLLLGKPIVADPFMPAIAGGAQSIVFGDFSQYVIRLVGDMRFERSDDFAFGTDLVSFRIVVRLDGQYLAPSATSFPRSQPLVSFTGGAS
jgi:HK97 family phage major capsid protein